MQNPSKIALNDYMYLIFGDYEITTWGLELSWGLPKAGWLIFFQIPI